MVSHESSGGEKSTDLALDCRKLPNRISYFREILYKFHKISHSFKRFSSLVYIEILGKWRIKQIT